MIKRSVFLKLSTAISTAILCLAARAFAQGANPAQPTKTGTEASNVVALTEILVTAQKRSERINDVPMSITAATGEMLQSRGVSTPADLVKVVPGFQYNENFYNAPVFTIRGVGFSDNSAAARPTVSVYVDEIPLPFSALTQGVALDLERVEVLKGPQGTLFGTNSTGGAINFIATKPTRDFLYGGDFTIGSFAQGSASGYVSGGLSDTVSVRVAVEQQFGDGWQKSVTRNDKLGKRNKTLGRILVDYHPTDRLRFMLNLNGFLDKSDVKAAQYIATVPLVPGGALPPQLTNYPLPRNNRDADWSTGLPLTNDAKFYQIALRSEFDLTSNIMLTSITSYDKYKNDKEVDPDGVSLRNNDYNVIGDIKTFAQELRLSGSAGDLHWVVGGNYQHDKVFESANQLFLESTAIGSFAGFGLGLFNGVDQFKDERYTSKAGFANIDYEFSPELTAHAGVRYTEDNGRAESCAADIGDGVFSTAFTIIYTSIRGAFGLSPVNIPPGGCITGHVVTPASIADGTALNPGVGTNFLKENNTSWRVGLDWKPSTNLLVYGNVSEGFKGGSFPLFGPSVDTQTAPAKQESVRAYELGFKATLHDRRVQLNGAVFHYDYSDKQFAGRVVLDPNIFGAIESVVNVPKSTVDGAEVQLDIAPIEGLVLSGGITYLDTKIKTFSNFNVFGVVTDFSGQSFPTSPKFQMVADAQYQWHASGKLDAFVGASGNYQSKSNGLFGDYDLFKIKSWSTLDLRAGIQAPDGRWNVFIWGRNVTDTKYWNSANRVLDTAIRFSGAPATYGITFSIRGLGK
jgi:iron complex outermembrane recepter protein